MKHTCLALLLAGALVGTAAVAKDSVAPDPRVGHIIEERGLQQSATAIRDNPAWQPQRVVVTLPANFTRLMPELEALLRKTAGSVDLVLDTSGNRVTDAATLDGADAFIGVCSRPTLENASTRLLWVHHFYAGMEGCASLPEELIGGRLFTNSKRLASPAIAEHTMAMLLSLATGLPGYQRAQAENRWDRSLAATPKFGELQGKTLLVVGLGGIGTEIARRANRLGMTVTATRNSSREGPEFVEYVGLSQELPALAAKADVVVNALPLTSQTRGIFDKAFFDNMKSGAIFLSVGRGASTVTADLIAALKAGELYGAGLDVTDPEPLPADSPLWQMSNVIITPHISAVSPDSGRRTALIAVENLRRYLAGGKLLNVVNMQAGY